MILTSAILSQHTRVADDRQTTSYDIHKPNLTQLQPKAYIARILFWGKRAIIIPRSKGPDFVVRATMLKVVVTFQ